MVLLRPIPSILAIAMAITVASWPSTTPDTASARGDVQTDTVAIDITNNMAHPMILSYGPDSARVPLGRVDGSGQRTVRLPNPPGDSVTVWATNDDPPHKLSHTFPTHTKTVLSWTF
jgi:hypothetical protein